MITASKVIPHLMLALRWGNNLMTRSNMSIKVGRKPHDMRILGRIVGARSAEQSVLSLLTLKSYDVGVETIVLR